MKYILLFLLAQLPQPFIPGTIGTVGKPRQTRIRQVYVQVNAVTPDDRRCEGLVTDTGSAMSCNLLPQAFTDHVPLALWPAVSNAGAFTLTINGITGNVLDANGNAPLFDDYQAGHMYWIFYDGANYRPFGN